MIIICYAREKTDRIRQPKVVFYHQLTSAFYYIESWIFYRQHSPNTDSLFLLYYFSLLQYSYDLLR